MSERFEIEIKAVFVVISKEQKVLELILPNPCYLQDHCEELNQRTVIVDNLDPNKWLEHISEVDSEPIF